MEEGNGLGILLVGKRDKNCWWIGYEMRKGERQQRRLRVAGKVRGKLGESCGNQN